ncbi:hypothetical protein [Delftia tsuruhatensis]|uniref:hypothetical protein n=1 Tax=Delftia tsuruhatensis TaxID=180282 RepID=UPI00301E1DCB
MFRFAVIASAVLLAGCATVRQSDLDAWVGVPVEALDTHSIFLTIPMYRTITPSGIEVRNYLNSDSSESCFGTTNATGKGRTVNATTFASCSNQKVVCNNIFYIKDGKVLEYAPTGNCFTNESARPQSRYKNLMPK